METSICNNCINDTDCSYQNDTPSKAKVSCESHEIEQGQIKLLKAKKLYQVEAAIDLCSVCDHKQYCTSRSPDHFIFQCEQYN